MSLHLYFARKFVMTFGGLALVFALLITMLDVVEQLRKFESAQIGLSGALELALLSMPQTLYRVLPLVMILATLALFLNLARTSELVVTRAAGRSALRALIAPVLTAVAIGGVGIAVLNPIVAGTMQQYELRSAAYSDEGRQVLSISREGLWLRQGDPEGQTVIRAEQTNLDGTKLFNVTFIAYGSAEDAAQRPIRRIQAASATLIEGAWDLEQAKVWDLTQTNPELAAETFDDMRLPSSLTQAQIRDSFGSPAAIPIWELPSFIRNLDEAGFSARLHRVWFQMELALPLFLAAMVLVGASFTLRHTRFGRTGLMVMFALLLGFSVYFLRNLAQVMGETGQIPIALAAWAPPAVAILLSLGVLFHLEDG